MMIPRSIWLLVFILLVRPLSFAADFGVTTKDTIAYQMVECFSYLETTESIKNQFKREGILTNNNKLNSEIKRRIGGELTNLYSLFSKSKGGIHSRDLWQIYNRCGEYLDRRPKPQSIKPKPRRALSYLKKESEKSLMGLAKDFAAVHAAMSHDVDLKLSVLTRENRSTQLKTLLSDSFTLYIPMARALEKVRDECSRKKIHINSTTSFMNYLVEELKQNYWRDENFVTTLRYLKEYFEYEYRVAKSQWSKQYPLLKYSDVDNLSRQFLASFIFLNLVSGFLQTYKDTEWKDFSKPDERRLIVNYLNLSPSAFKDFAKADELKFDYHAEKPLVFSETSPLWNEFIELILTDHEPRLRIKSLSRSGSRHLSKKLVPEEKMYGFSQNRPINFADTLAAIVQQFKNGFGDPGLISPPQINQYLKKIITIEDEEDFFFSVIEFGELQNIIRSQEKYYVADKTSLIGAHGDVLEELARVETWGELVEAFKKVSERALKENNDQLGFLSEEISHALLLNIYFLEERDLLELLQTFLNARMENYSFRVYQFLKKIKVASENREELKRSFTNVKFDLAASSSVSETNLPSLSTTPIFFHYSHQNIKVKIPKTGIRQIVSALKRTVFGETELELLTRVARLAKPKTLDRGQIYYQQNEDSDSFGLITDGGFEVYNDNSVLGILSKDQLVGFMSIFEVKPKRSASVRAKEVTTVYEFPIGEFRKLMKENPALMQALVKQLAKTVGGQQQKLRELGIDENCDGQIGPISSMKSGDMLALGPKIKVGSVAQGEVLVEANHLAHNLYYVQKGSLSRGARPASLVKKKSYLDEIAFLAGTKHPFKVTGNSQKCMYLYFNIDDFMQLSRENPEFMQPMARQLNAIIRANNIRLGDTEAFKLQLALERGDLAKIIEIFSASGIDINGSCPLENAMPKGSRPVHIAARYNYPQVLTYLLDNGANVDEIDDFGNTASHIAAKRNYLEIMKILKDRYASLNLLNYRGKTPYDLANDRGHKQITDCLMGN